MSDFRKQNIDGLVNNLYITHMGKLRTKDKEISTIKAAEHDCSSLCTVDVTASSNTMKVNVTLGTPGDGVLSNLKSTNRIGSKPELIFITLLYKFTEIYRPG